MADLMFYGVKGGKVIGPYHPDEFGARARAVAHLRRQYRGQDVFTIAADTYEEARRKINSAR
jgi:hypothetical protein